MKLFSNKSSKLTEIKEKPFKLERDIPLITFEKTSNLIRWLCTRSLKSSVALQGKELSEYVKRRF